MQPPDPRISLACVLLAMAGCTTGGGALHLTRSTSGIKAEILAITPVGTTAQEAEKTIKQKIHPETFYTNTHCYIGDQYIIKSFGCQLGRYWWPGQFFATDVDADWYFDGKDRLVKVVVTRQGECF